MNCTSKKTQSFVKGKLEIDNFPGLAVYGVGKKTKLLPKVKFAKFHSIIEIVKDISDSLGDHTRDLRSDQIHNAITITLLDKKIILILFHDSLEISMSYRVLSQLSQYKDKFVFTHVRNPSPDLVESFNIKGLPTLIALFTDESQRKSLEINPEYIQLARFKQKYIFSDLAAFLEMVYFFFSLMI